MPVTPHTTLLTSSRQVQMAVQQLCQLPPPTAHHAEQACSHQLRAASPRSIKLRRLLLALPNHAPARHAAACKVPAPHPTPAPQPPLAPAVSRGQPGGGGRGQKGR
mmetsp:Transcript_21570/g.54907  ORF Transcript_21570/g.54907 Transcript_21570/m.54907 type:complete len:106 (+) Transcript_21570:359-676(+)